MAPQRGNVRHSQYIACISGNVANVQNRFQWADLQVKQILKCETEEAARNRLGKLPRGLEATYREIYDEIKDRDKNDKAMADRAIMWVMCACKPLNSQELLSAIRVDSDKDTVDLASKITESSLLALCSNLLVLDSQRHVWRFSHLSVTEYFEKHHWSLQQAHCHAAKVSLKLLAEAYKGPTVEVVSEDIPESQDIFKSAHLFQKYSRCYWMTHIRIYEVQQAKEGEKMDHLLSRLLKAFLGSPGKSSLQYQRWYLQVPDRRTRPNPLTYSRLGVPDISPESVAAFAMCRFSLYAVLQDWWNGTEIDPSRTNTNGDSLLVLAILAGCKPICERLIKLGASVNLLLQSGDYGSALVAAAVYKNVEMVEFLVEKGADVNLLLQCGGYGSALAAAAIYGRIETVKFLVEKGADVNLLLRCGEYGSALVAAAACEKIEIVEFLVEKGADVNLLLQCGGYGSALAAAAIYGRIETVEFLVEKGADVNLLLQCGRYGSALVTAAAYGRIETVKFLIEKGADVNLLLQCGNYGSALATAIYGNIKMVEFLVEKGADVNLLLQCGNYGSALAAGGNIWKDRNGRILGRERGRCEPLASVWGVR